MNKIVFAAIAAWSVLVSGSAVAAATETPRSFSERAVIERIKPVGSVCVEGQDCGVAVAEADTEAREPRSGDAIYGTACTTCHASGVAGAPVMGNAADWAPRIAQGMDTLVSHAINGLNAMPPKGMCMDCSDEELRATVEYMVSQSR